MNTHTECVNMIKQQLRTGDVLNETILNLFQTIPRDAFVPEPYKPFAYSDLQIQLPHNQRMMTPLEEARLLQVLALEGNETILEVGTGTGFLTTLLSKLCNHVISIDYFSDFTATARRNLEKHDCKNVELVTGDASRGWIEKAPYDVVLFTGALEELTDSHRLQVLPGGKLFAIIGRLPIMQGEMHHLDHNGQWRFELVFETCIPPLIDPIKPKEFVF